MTEAVDHLVPTADGTTIAVRELAGSGSLIVALHGFTGNGATMQPLIERVRGPRPALLVDIVGHGASDAPEHLEPYEMSSVVDQVLSVIGQREPATVHLLGYSMGGRVAMSMAARAPWYFASVTTLSATAGIADPAERAARHEADLALAQRIENDGVEAFAEWWLSLPLFEPLVASLEENELAATLAQRRANTARGLANSVRRTGTGAMAPVWDRLGSLRSPFLAVAGGLDERYVEIAERMAEAAPFGRTAVVPGAGHAVHVENPGEVSRLLRDFLEGCETVAP